MTETANAKYYEKVGDTLKGKQAERAYRAAQNHLDAVDKKDLENWKRLQNKLLIVVLEKS
jgi:hypothetical protein